ncbi:MAG: leucine--tRNA ligase [Pirellulales bacterium]|nr:leucine--tRNA ligase [Pirellulales bacterium]
MPRYNPAEIEPKWQAYWEAHRTFATPRLPPGEKRYYLDMFPYPSGDGLHVGHPEGYTATDILSRFERMRGRTVLHPMGFDAFGLPAEENAIKNGIPPRVSTEKNIANFVRQLKALGFSYDWQRQLSTTDLDYVRWTQWIFLVLFDTWFDSDQQRGRPISELPIPPSVTAEGPTAVAKYQDEHRLAYISEAPVNWCPALGTVLANEEVIGGLSERGRHPVVRIPLRQWMLRITAYADRLEQGLANLHWPESIKKLQRDWIGRSTGAEVDFYIGPAGEFESWKASRQQSGWPAKPGADVLRIYTTRPDTLYGATYMVIAPEHAAVARLTTPDNSAAVKAYCDQAATKSDLDRTELAKVKTGVFTGSYALNPVNGAKMPIWIADYVLATYGTGAIMAVPAHDERDFEFAQVFGLPIIPVVDPGEAAGVERNSLLACEKSFVADGAAINSGKYNGTPSAQFKPLITRDLAASGLARAAVNYKLRDWLFSRQRFWGEPFPILHELDDQGQFTGRYRAVPVEQLPVPLPHLDDYKPLGRPEPPLEKAAADWLYVTLDGERYKRETNTMPQWAGSCWYYLRFIDPKNETALIDPALEAAWMPVDLYIGGAEHAVLHLLYSRFWHMVLFDRGHVRAPEPFTRLVNQGMILGEAEYHITPAMYALHESGIHASGVTTVHLPAKEAGGKESYVLKVADEMGKLGNLTEELVEKRQGKAFLRGTPVEMTSLSEKMSKSRGNVVNPDHIVQEFGADSLRLYEMFMGPLEATKPWSTTGVNGVRGFLDRAWRLIVNEKAEVLELHPAVVDQPPTEEQLRILHKTIAGVTADLEALSFNTAIAKMMEFTNAFTKLEQRSRLILEQFVLLLAPFAPHLAEELWQILGKSKTLAYEPWPRAEERYLTENELEIPVQILGKLRGRIVVPAESTADQQEAAARADSRIAELLAGKTIVKVIVVPGKLVNFVVK